MSPADTTELGRIQACLLQQGGRQDFVAALTCASHNGKLTAAQTACAKEAAKIKNHNHAVGRLSECLPS